MIEIHEEGEPSEEEKIALFLTKNGANWLADHLPTDDEITRELRDAITQLDKAGQ